LQPEIILAAVTPATAALQRGTGTIPIVFAGVADPVASLDLAELGFSRVVPAPTGRPGYERGDMLRLYI
jgi:hypothetical protein